MQFNFSEINVRKKIKNFNEKFTRVTILLHLIQLVTSRKLV